MRNSAGAFGDYDNDGDLDIALAGRFETNQVSVLYRNDNGVFAAVPAGLLGMQQSTVTWAEFNNDGRLDLLVTGYNRTSSVEIILYRNDGDGTFMGIPSPLTGFIGGTPATAVGDIDNDGDVDIVISGGLWQRPPKVLRNDGNFSFTDFTIAQVPGYSSGSLALGDIDGDWDLDLVLSAGPTTYWLENVGDLYTNSVMHPIVDIRGTLALGDYNGDNYVDLAVSGVRPPGYYASAIILNAAGNFITVQTNLAGLPDGTVSWGDVDNDGDLDLLMTGNGGYGGRGAVIYRNDGGEFNAVYSGLEEPNFGYDQCALGDFDGDNDLDVLVGRAEWFDLRRVFRNDLVEANTRPTPPSELAATVVSNAVYFTWSAGIDLETPFYRLSYNLRVGTMPGGSEVISPHANAGGVRNFAAAGNAGYDEGWILKGLVPGRYYWSVQTLDSAFVGSAFAGEESFIVTDPAAARIVQVERDGAGTWRVRLLGISGRPYRLQVSSNLISWHDGSAATEISPGVFEASDSTQNAVRFYRAVTP